MKRIQPFTIGTKLSVPSETRCLDYVDIISTVEGLDCCEQGNGPIDDSNSSSVHQEQGSTSSPVEGPLHEFKEDDDRNSASPSGSSRSIRKIAMCTNAERHINCIGVDLNETNRSGFEKNLIPERLREKPGAQLETDQLSKGMKIRNLCCDYRISAFPCDQAENTGHSQRRELNDIENSLIQLTTSLDLMECTEEPGGPPQKNTDVPELGLEMFHRKSPKDHSDKSWLKLRSLLKHYHQDLILALDVSSYYQQADSIIGNINTKRSCVLAGEISKSDKENQEIACQINMLNECASRLSTLHPTLARRVTCKQAEVKENWALLQELLRNPKTDVSSKPPSTLPIDPLTTIPDSQSFSRNEGHCVMGKDVKEEQNRLRGFECSRGLWTHRMWSPVEECSVGSQGSLSESSCSKLDLISQDTRSCISQMAQTTPVSSQECLSPNKQLSESTKSPGVTDCSKARQDSKLEELLSQVEVLWDALQRKYGENSEVEAQNKEQAGFKASQMVSELTLPNESEGEGRSGMLERFLELLDPSGYQRMSQYHTEPLEMLEAAEISLNQLHNQAAYKRFQEHDQSTDELQRLIATLTLRINQHLCRCAELSMDLLDIETDTTVFRDLSCLEELHEQQNDQEDHYNIIEAEVHEMERLATQQQIPPPQRRDPLREEVQAILQAWEEVGRSMAENRVRLSKFQQIREYFEKYLNMITWTENTRSCLLAGSSAWRNSEAAEIDRSIKTKLDEFSKLTAAAQSLMQEESPLKDIIKERTDELQSMLGWIQVNWRSKRHQLERSQNGGDERINNPVQQQVLPFTNPSNNICILNRELKGIASETQLCSSAQHLARHDISSVSHESCLSKTTLGSSICLILSFDEQSTGINQVTTQWSPNNETYEEPKSNIQEENEQSQAKVQQVEICEVTWPTDAVLSNGTKQMTSYGNLEQLQNSYQGEPTQSLNKQIETSLISLGNAESSSLNHSTDKLEPVSEESNLQLFPVIDHADSSQLLTKSKERVQISAYNDYTNQQQCKDHLRHEVSAEVTHRVFTYLHVSDSNRLPGRVLVATSIPLDKDEDMDSPLSQGVTSQEGAVSRQNRSNLKKPMKIKEKVLHRNSTLGTVGMESSGNPSSIFRQRCNTWPEGECRVKARSYSNSKLEIFIRSDTPPVNAVTDDNYTPLPEENLPNVVKTSSGGVKNICSYLSLGSTLSFSLPRRFDNSVLVTENKVECESLQEYIVPIKQGAQTPLFEMKQESVTVTNKADHNLQKVDNLENTSQNKTQQLTHMYIKTEPALMSENYSVIQNKAAPPKAKTSSSSPLDHQCLSVHTKIKDLNGHLYNMSKHMKISSLENSTDTLSSCKRSRIINCGVQDCAVCFSETEKKKPDVIMQELLQPGHWLFQQDEEELEDIWRGKLGNLNYTEETNMDEKTARNRIPTAKV